MQESKRRLGIATIIYWVLLLYIMAAFIWWFVSLYKQNEEAYDLRKQITLAQTAPSLQQGEMERIADIKRRNNAKYLGEGSAFFLLLLVGAVYIYRSVRRQFRLQQQQQNFVMAVTHELKTPLSVARLNLETIQRHQLQDARREKLIQMTLQETLRLDNLINNILISSQLEGHSYEVLKEELNFSDLVQDVAGQFSTRYTDRTFLKSVQPEIDMKGDALLLKLLVSNLLENANKYSPRDKPVSISLKRDNNQIDLNILDEGDGIPPAERKNIFKKFYRIGNEQTRKTKGTGLGLFLCKKIVEDHKGQISISDNQPHGSNFVIQFSA